MDPTVVPFLAHAGGWDEALVLLGGPLLVFLVLRYMGRQDRGEPPQDGTPAERHDDEAADDG